MRRFYLLSALLLAVCAGCLGPGNPNPTLPAAPKIRLGYSMEHPLPMASVLDSVEYLDRLRTVSGEPVTYRRVGSVKLRAPEAEAPPASRFQRMLGMLGIKREPGRILDRYELNLPDGPVTLWFDPYAERSVTEPPEGFSFGSVK